MDHIHDSHNFTSTSMSCHYNCLCFAMTTLLYLLEHHFFAIAMLTTLNQSQRNPKTLTLFCSVLILVCCFAIFFLSWATSEFALDWCSFLANIFFNSMICSVNAPFSWLHYENQMFRFINQTIQIHVLASGSLEISASIITKRRLPPPPSLSFSVSYLLLNLSTLYNASCFLQF